MYGHRGASAAERENTLAAFDTARRMGADGVELDVRRTADGALVVAHDPLLADGRALVSLDRAELPPDVLELHEAQLLTRIYLFDGRIVPAPEQ